MIALIVFYKQLKTKIPRIHEFSRSKISKIEERKRIISKLYASKRVFIEFGNQGGSPRCPNFEYTNYEARE